MRPRMTRPALASSVPVAYRFIKTSNEPIKDVPPCVDCRAIAELGERARFRLGLTVRCPCGIRPIAAKRLRRISMKLRWLLGLLVLAPTGCNSTQSGALAGGAIGTGFGALIGAATGNPK